MVILIMGLPGSGKTTLAAKLVSELQQFHSVEWFNADKIRESFNDWDFSEDGRLRQAERMKKMSQQSLFDIVICDFVAPTNSIREYFDPDIVIWLNTIEHSRFEDTNKIFEPPHTYDFLIPTKDSDHWSKIIAENIIKSFK